MGLRVSSEALLFSAAAFLALGTVVAAQVRAAEAGDSPTPARLIPRASAADKSREMAAGHVVGASACSMCHVSEHATWSRTRHARSLDELRDNPKAKLYAERLKIPAAEITKSTACIGCHAVVMVKAGAVNAISGVSCESCHGAAGGEPGWLNAHSSFGPRGVTRRNEDPAHRAERIARIERFGMTRPERMNALLSRCYECHIVSESRLVDVAGHSSGRDFEIVLALLGEVRHNFLADEDTNAGVPRTVAETRGVTEPDHRRFVYVVGLLLDLEHSLRSLAGSTANGPHAHAQAMAARVRDTLTALQSVREAVPGTPLNRLVFNQEHLSGKLSPDFASELRDLADRVNDIASQFEQKQDLELRSIDRLVPRINLGKVYEP